MDEDPLSSPQLSGSTTHTLIVEILDTDRLISVELSQWIRDAAIRVCAPLDHAGEIRVRLVNDEQMRDAHARYSNIPTTTDVLTFDLAHAQPIDGKVLDTDLIVCVDEATRQASTRQHNTEHELLLYIVHGVLHCLGYNDQDDESFKRMHTKEDQLFELAGFRRLFHTPSDVDANAETQS